MRPCSSFANVSAIERRQLEEEVRRGRTAIRALMILLSAAGYPAVSIAELVGYDPRTVRRWIERFIVEGVGGLPDRFRTGRPCSTAQVTGRLSTLLAQPKAWTVPSLARALRWSASSSTRRRRRQGLAQWRRPRLVAKGDPEAPLRWAAVRRALRQLPAHAVVLAEDDWHLNPLPWVRATWILRGQRQLVMTPGRNQRRYLFGAVELSTGKWCCQVARRANGAAFVRLLECLLETYADAPAIAVVLDNVIIHSSHRVHAWLLEHPQLHLLYGARYCPHENPVERIWGAMKAHLANSPPPTMPGPVSQAMNFFAAATPEQMLQTAAPWKARWLPSHHGQDLCKAA